jgi:hypothetical protein
MNSVIPVEVTKRIAKIITKAEGGILKIGIPGSDCLIYQGGKPGKVLVRVVTTTGDNSFVAGNVKGKLFTKEGLLKLVKEANSRMNQAFMDSRAFPESKIQNVLPDQIVELKHQMKFGR